MKEYGWANIKGLICGNPAVDDQVRFQTCWASIVSGKFTTVLLCQIRLYSVKLINNYLNIYRVKIFNLTLQV